MPDIACWAATAAGSALTPFQYEAPVSLPSGSVRIRITHCGICHSDIHQIDNDWKVAVYPLVPGHEIVGVVEEISPEDVNSSLHQVGTRVGIGPQRGCCGKPTCCVGSENVCPQIKKTYGGKDNDRGGFSSYIIFPASWCFAIPTDLPSEFAAPLLCAGITTYTPLKRHVQGGMQVGILGIGGLGHLALQYAKAMVSAQTESSAPTGRVVALSASEGKREEAMQFGADSFLLTTDTSAMVDSQGTLDVILCTASGNLPWDSFLDLLKPGGKFVLVGLPAKDTPMTLFAQSFVRSDKSLVGSYLGPYHLYQEMLQFSANHKIVPKIEVLPFSEINAAVDKVRRNEARYRMVVEM